MIAYSFRKDGCTLDPATSYEYALTAALFGEDRGWPTRRLLTPIGYKQV
jgi:hypothetical protein